MSLVKRCVKGLYAGFIDKKYPKGLVYCHIPKCGGTSLREALRKKFIFSKKEIEADEAYKAVMDERYNQVQLLKKSRKFRSEMLKYYLEDGKKYISGHCPINSKIISLYKHEYDFISVLRNPVDRFISHYRYSYMSGNHGNINEGIEDYILTDRAKMNGVIYSDYFGCNADGNKLDKAKETLNSLSFFGFVENMDSVEKYLNGELGINIEISHSNVGKNRNTYYGGDIPKEIIYEIENICKDDIEIYDYAKELYNEKFSSHN